MSSAERSRRYYYANREARKRASRQYQRRRRAARNPNPPGELEYLRYFWDPEYADAIRTDRQKLAQWLAVTKTVREETGGVNIYRLDRLSAPGAYRTDLRTPSVPSPTATHRLYEA